MIDDVEDLSSRLFSLGSGKPLPKLPCTLLPVLQYTDAMKSLEMEDVIIYSAKRTAIGKMGGALSHLPASYLATTAIRAVLDDAAPVILQDDVTEVELGHVLNAGCGMNTARQASLDAGLSNKVTAYTVNMVCGSGMKAIVNAAKGIKCGDNVVSVAGGMESMSQAPHLIRLRVTQHASNCSGTTLPPSLPDLPRFGDMPLVDSLVNDGLTEPVLHCRMGDTAEMVAHRYEIKRCEQDKFALRSHMQWATASSSGRFKLEVVPIPLDTKTSSTSFVTDELARPNLTLDRLAKLQPVFELPKFQTSPEDNQVKPLIVEGHVNSLTAGNCSGLNDGAAAVMLVSSSFLKHRIAASPLCSRGLAKIVSWGQTGGQPEFMGIEVVPAVRLALSRAGWDIGSVDVWEINEAFAVTTIVAIKQLEIPDWENRVNLNGGAIAIGHPIGASGARLIVTLAHQLAMMQAKEPSKVFRGVATACIGGGQAIACCLESIPASYFEN